MIPILCQLQTSSMQPVAQSTIPFNYSLTHDHQAECIANSQRELCRQHHPICFHTDSNNVLCVVTLDKHCICSSNARLTPLRDNRLRNIIIGIFTPHDKGRRVVILHPVYERK